MEKVKKLKYFFVFVVSGVLIKYLIFTSSETSKVQLYWFIPDGLRAEPVTFKIFEWAKEGKLPHLAKLINNGSYGYSIPVFPGHTPSNFATLMTGVTPSIHGVADGAMRVEGYPLKVVAKGGFSSHAKNVDPLWYTLEKNNSKVTLLSIPGSTPPELDLGVTIKGRWGGWGVDFPAINFHSSSDKKLQQASIPHKSAFNFGSELTRFISPSQVLGWSIVYQSFSPAREINLKNWNAPLFGLVIDTTDDKIENYDQVIFSKDKKNILEMLKEGDWGNWNPIELSWQLKNESIPPLNVFTQVKIKIIKLGQKDFFRIRLLYNHLNQFSISPEYLYPSIYQDVGPMVDFVDNFPPQLIYLKEDKKTFIEEADFSLKWHKKMAHYMLTKMDGDVIIHSIYTPNQMLTSRWWLPYLDPSSSKYQDISEEERGRLWNEVYQMYRGIDDILGEVMSKMPKNSYIVFSSDHGAIPLDQEVKLNNLFAKKGWLKFHKNSSSNEYEIDWKHSKVVFLQMDSIYINPKGLDGLYVPARGDKYERLRDEVIAVLEELKDEKGRKPLSRILKREQSHLLDLPPDRVGDLIVANEAQYNFVEDVSEDFSLFKNSLKGGYKQAVLPEKNVGMWTPFVVSGPGVKKNHYISTPVQHVDQYATIFKLLGMKSHQKMTGKVIKEILTLKDKN